MVWARRAGLRTVDDVESFETWFPRLLPFAYNVGFRFSGGDTSFAEEVAQEALTRAYTRWERIRRHPNLEAWITTTGFHVALELTRQQRRVDRVDASKVVVDVPGEEQRVADADELVHALRRLSTRQQEVLLWRYYFDLSVEQTAGQMGLTESKVKDATHEAVTKLGRLLQRERKLA